MKHYRLKDKNNNKYTWIDFKIDTEGIVTFLRRGRKEWEFYGLLLPEEMVSWLSDYELVSKVNYLNKPERE